MSESADIRENRLEILYDHYKETCEQVSDARKSRNSAFLYTIGVLLLLSVVDVRANGVLAMINSALASRVADQAMTGSAELLSARAFNTVLWALLVAVLIQYYRMSSHTYRLYAYLVKLENQINRLLGSAIVCREGADYYGALRLCGCGQGCLECEECELCDKNWLVNVNKEERKVLGVKWVDTEVRSGFTGKNQLGVSSTTGIALANLTFRFLFPIVAIGLLALRMWRECTEEPIGGIGVVAVTTNAVLCVVAIMLFVFGGVLRNWEY